MGTNKEREERKSEREWKQIRERMGKNNEIFINKSDRIKNNEFVRYYNKII